MTVLETKHAFGKRNLRVVVLVHHTSFVPVAIRGRIIPNYATIDCNERIPFWREVGKKVHEYDCKLIMQLSHSGRQQDISELRI